MTDRVRDFDRVVISQQIMLIRMTDPISPSFGPDRELSSLNASYVDFSGSVTLALPERYAAPSHFRIDLCRRS